MNTRKKIFSKYTQLSKECIRDSCLTTFVFNSREFAIDTFSKAKYFPGCLWKFFKARV